MGKTKIEWTDYSWNPIRGTKGRHHCTKISDGCKNCYAEKMNIRFGGPKYTAGADTIRLDEKVLQEPLKLKKPHMVFVCSMTDLFHEQVPDEWIIRMFKVMIQASSHIFQVLTKRTERLQKFAYEFSDSPNWPPPNVWFVASTEDQDMADLRIPQLLGSRVGTCGVSIEPMLGPIDLSKYLGEHTYHCACGYKHEEDEMMYQGDGQYRCIRCGELCCPGPTLDWVIVGGESGPSARPMHPDWARKVLDQCMCTDTPFYFKQWGGWVPYYEYTKTFRDLKGKLGYRQVHPDGTVSGVNGPESERMAKVGKKKSGRVLDGKTYDEFPSSKKRMSMKLKEA